MSPALQTFRDDSFTVPVCGFLHRPDAASGRGLVLTHGAGSNGNTSLLIALAEAFAGAGFSVLRCDLPFRQNRAFGPPRPGDAERDREGLRGALAVMRKLGCEQVFLGGHSYGGRQATMLSAEQCDLAAGLLLLSYPLHPPRKAEQLRTQHFPRLQTPALFIHGTRDPFGSIAEMTAALAAIPARHQLVAIEKAGHELGAAAAAVILREAECFANA
jgi:predicted alpha/beta-hydrolase family hydrolase